MRQITLLVISLPFTCRYFAGLLTLCEGNSPVTGEFPSQRTVALWCFLWSPPEQTVEQTIETPVIWDAIWDAHYDVTIILCFLPTLQTMKELKDYFCTSIMVKLEKHSERTVLLLDSLDQLRDFGCKLRGWIPKNLPENVTLLLSCIPAEEYVVGPELKVRAGIWTHWPLDDLNENLDK